MKVVKNLKELWKLIIERREEIMSTVAKKIVPAQRFKTKDFFRCATHGKGEAGIVWLTYFYAGMLQSDKVTKR